MSKYWYFKTIFYCPLCGRSKVYKERRSSPRPEKYWDRVEEIEAFDYCDY